MPRQGRARTQRVCAPKERSALQHLRECPPACQRCQAVLGAVLWRRWMASTPSRAMAHRAGPRGKSAMMSPPPSPSRSISWRTTLVCSAAPRRARGLADAPAAAMAVSEAAHAGSTSGSNPMATRAARARCDGSRMVESSLAVWSSASSACGGCGCARSACTKLCNTSPHPHWPRPHSRAIARDSCKATESELLSSELLDEHRLQCWSFFADHAVPRQRRCT